MCRNVQAYLGNFYKFCEDLGGVTAEVMCPILQVGHLYCIQIMKTFYFPLYGNYLIKVIYDISVPGTCSPYHLNVIERMMSMDSGLVFAILYT